MIRKATTVLRSLIAALRTLVGSKRMTFDVSPYVPEPSDWLSIADQLRGRATLRFQDPPGSVEGDAELVFNETGEVSVEVQLDPATLRVESGVSEGLLLFIQPGRSGIAGGRRFTVHSFGDPLNPCSRLEMVTPKGVLTTEDVDDYSPHVTVGDGKDEMRIVFEPSGAAFDVVGSGPPKYWVVPLLNFVSTFPQREPVTDRHLLRIYQTPVVPGNLSNEEREAAFEAANDKNELIVFEFEDRPGTNRVLQHETPGNIE